jgi:hypothetical protein
MKMAARGAAILSHVPILAGVTGSGCHWPQLLNTTFSEYTHSGRDTLELDGVTSMCAKAQGASAMRRITRVGPNRSSNPYAVRDTAPLRWISTVAHA